MKKQSLDIIEFAQHPQLLNNQQLSDAQIAVLKSIYGLPLSEVELRIYQQATGRQSYPETEQRETTLMAGRQGGKTTLSSIIACYEAFRDHLLPAGRDGCVMLLAPTIDQARIAFKYIRNYLRNSPILSKRIRSITKSEITLKNNIVIACHACTYDRVRGRVIVAVICDELGFWADDQSANPAQEVLDALRPGMITVSNAKLVKISTPFLKAGLLWEEFQRRSELPFAVWQLSTFAMNPSITPEKAAAERLESEEQYRREYLAEFTDAIDAWITPEVLEPCIVRERRELPRMDNVNYFAAIDPASRKNDYALVILHKDRDQNIIVDRVEFWTGTKTAPLPFERILGQIKEILQSYEINSVTGDQFYCDAIGQHLLGLGVNYKVEVFGPQTRATIFTGLKHLMVQGKIQILDDPNLLRQLRTLRVEKTPRGQIDVRPSSGNDDIAVALALAANEAIMQQLPLTIDLIPFDTRPSAASLGLIPGNCYVENICGNHPRCIDVGECLDFLDLRLVQIAS